jgi:hypothetical protein
MGVGVLGVGVPAVFYTAQVSKWRGDMPFGEPFG